MAGGHAHGVAGVATAYYRAAGGRVGRGNGASLRATARNCAPPRLVPGRSIPPFALTHEGGSVQECRQGCDRLSPQLAGGWFIARTGCRLQRARARTPGVQNTANIDRRGCTVGQAEFRVPEAPERTREEEEKGRKAAAQAGKEEPGDGRRPCRHPACGARRDDLSAVPRRMPPRACPPHARGNDGARRAGTGVC